ncbi:adenylosuccinate lyase [bacterium]|nr:adenylosuccinate lyase [bacterium]
MIPRYSPEEISSIWTDESRFQYWLAIEIAACEAWAKLGKIPRKDLQKIKKRAKFQVDKINKIEKKVKHDVIAFLTNVADNVGGSSRFIHMGMTSSDVLDTAFALQMRDSAKIIMKDLDRLLVVLKKQAKKYKDVPQMGRSHGIHAEPTTFGLKLLLWYSEFKRNKERLERATKNISVGKISGAVGTYANIDPNIEKYICEKLGLKPADVSTQVVQRDHHAEFFTTLAIVAGSIEKVAIEVRHLQRTEVLEVAEPFTKGQKGSSAMPHKRNPILSENLTGLARLVRHNAGAALENIALWHERDISHSSVERVIGPDSTILVDFMLKRLAGMLDGLVVYQKNMEKNLNLTGGLIFSQQVMLKLIEKGVMRERSYKIIQRNAAKVWDDGANFKESLANDDEVKKYLTSKELDKIFDVKQCLRHVNKIFKRVLK